MVCNHGKSPFYQKQGERDFATGDIMCVFSIVSVLTPADY